MSTVDVQTPDGKASGSVELPDHVFDTTANIALMHQVVIAQQGAARQGTHATTVPVGTVIHALRSAASYLVVDLKADRLEEQARWCSTVLVLTPRTVRGVLAATLAVQRCGDIPVMTVLTGLNVADVDAALVESASGAGCAGSLSFDPRLPQELDNGAALQRGQRSKHAKAVRAIARRLAVGS